MNFGCGSSSGGCHSGFGSFTPSISQFSSSHFGQLPPLAPMGAPYRGKFSTPLTPLHDIKQNFQAQCPTQLRDLNLEDHVSDVRTSKFR